MIKDKRFLSLVIVFAFTIGCLPVHTSVVYAKSKVDHTIAGVPIVIKKGMGDIEINGTWTAKDSKNYGQHNEEFVYNILSSVITVKSSYTGKIVLNNVHVDTTESSGFCAFLIEPGAKVIIELVGENTLVSGSDRAGLEITGAKVNITSSTSGVLKVQSENGAGIGGRTDGKTGKSGGNLTISGSAVIKAESDMGAGIGGGMGMDAGGYGGTIRIIDHASVTAQSIWSADIGGGSSSNYGTHGGSGGKIIIAGDSEVTAISSGIGGGDGYLFGGSGGNITIDDNANVVADSIGGGFGYKRGGSGGRISIGGNANVFVILNGIGGGGSFELGVGGSGGTINISDNATVIAVSESAGIGGGSTGAFVETIGSTDGDSYTSEPSNFGIGGPGGKVVVSGTPLVFAKSLGNAQDIGAGASYDGVLGKAGITKITGGSIFVSAEKIDNPMTINGRTDLCPVMIKVTDDKGNPIENVKLSITSGKNCYAARTDSKDINLGCDDNIDGLACAWLPVGEYKIELSDSDYKIRSPKTLTVSDKVLSLLIIEVSK